MRAFIYARVSTDDLSPDNQVHEIISAGFAVEPHRIIREHISGSVAASERPQFAKLLEKLERDDVLIVTKLDRLGRNAIDVRQTVERLSSMGVRTHCLALGGADLTSAAGKLTMTIISAVAEFERDLIIERTKAGLVRARAEGRLPGRKQALTHEQQDNVATRVAQGEAIATLAREFGVGRATIMRAITSQNALHHAG
jgi:putative DNA-invertase from lambdoid prophage Rac